ncbi:MAG: MBL fold metallo-hydrolase [Bacteroidetes bacterium]|nr:MBL fold metallo-hydrolase [Bacteroidota bacterium]
MKQQYELVMVNAGGLWLDGGAVFGIVPKTLWSRFHQADERNRIFCATYCLLIQGNGRIILVDTGCGVTWTPKERWIYSIEYCLLESLEKMGIYAGDVTDVILTHLHFDHAGGAVTNVDGVLRPTFPRAQYYIQRKQWEWALNPSEKDRGSYRLHQFFPLYEHRQVTFLDGNCSIFENISVLVTYGHTPAHQMIKIANGNATFLYCGDFLPFAAHLRIPYIMAYDNNPLITVHEKKELFQHAVEEQLILFLEHDPRVRAITVQKGEEGYEVANVFTQWPCYE